jgi:PAS domain S-box-containing protein
MTHQGVYDPALVGLSLVIAVVGAYTALDLASRMTASSGNLATVWLLAAAVAMGGGIWSMHFVGMLAFSMPGMDVRYNLGLTLFSLVLPIVATALAFITARRRQEGYGAVALSGTLMGIGIAAMHYTGMAAMHMAASLTFAPLWVALSILIAIGASILGIRLAFALSGSRQRLLAAFALGVAVAGMHYVAMAGAIFTLSERTEHATTVSLIDQTTLATWIATTTLLLLAIALGSAFVDRMYAERLAQQAAMARASDERYRLLVQSVRDYAIFLLDPEGRVANWNAGAERIKGYSEAEIIGQHFSRFYLPDDCAAGVPELALRTARENGKFEAEGWRLRRDGERFWASVIIDAVRNEDGDLVGYAKVTRDITERKNAEEALEQARQALFQAQKMEAIGQLTGGVAHDFNNLLMAVLAGLEMLRKRLPDDPRAARLLQNAVEAAERGASLTQRMLAFARRQNLQPRPVDVRALISGMIELLERSIGPAHRLQVKVDDALKPALVDPHHLELALLNLVVNARDAMEQGGVVAVSAREQANAEREASFIVLTVADTGSGMDDDTLSRATEPFFTTKGVGKGTGLGLSMVRGLAEQSGGQLVLMSRLGEGTTAEVWLPTAPDVHPSAQPIAIDEHAVSAEVRHRVLVVDDDPLVLEITANMLEELGHMVAMARSGAAALDLIDKGAIFDLVLCDQVMPNMTGVQLQAALRARLPSLPVVMASGFAELDADEAARVHLRKPFGQAELAQAIKEAIDSRRA